MTHTSKLRPLLTIAFVGATLVGCTASARIEQVEAQIGTFHTLLNEGSFEKIWYQGSTEFQKVVPREDFVAFLSAVNRKLGKHESSVQETWNVSYTPKGTVVALQYKSKFAEGAAVEDFVYQNDGALPQLLRYNIQSNVLILK